MDYLKSIFAGIVATAVVLAIACAAVAVILAATIATCVVFSVAPHSAWPLAIAIGYLIVGIGTAVGISECYA